MNTELRFDDSVPGRVPGTQGYQLIAIGDRKYVDLAIACAASIRYWDKERPIQLVTDAPPEAFAHLTHLFDTITRYVPRDGYTGPLNKLRMLDFATYDETMFIDADCLMLKPDIDAYWDELRAGYDVSVPGNWRVAGAWYGMPIEEMLRVAGVDRLVQMNSGVFYFKQTLKAREFFDTAQDYVARLGNFTQHNHRGTGAPDELAFAVTFGHLGIDPFRVRDRDGNAWMVSTISGSKFHLLPVDSEPRFVKEGAPVSPTLCHFVGLRPRSVYAELRDFFLGVPSRRGPVSLLRSRFPG